MHNQSQIIIGALHENEFHPDYQIVAADPLFLSCGVCWSNYSRCDHIRSHTLVCKQVHKNPAFQATNLVIQAEFHFTLRANSNL